MTRNNKHILTLCPKCDKQGHAIYKIRSGNDKLILNYRHDNEPPIEFKDVMSWGKLKKKAIYRECWVGNVLSESEFLGQITKSKPLPIPEPEPEPILKNAEPRRIIKPVIKQDKAVCLRLWTPPELVKKIDAKRGGMARGTFLMWLIIEALK